MALIYQYIMEFNKLVTNTNFLSCTNDISIKNKLFLIQQDINESIDFDSFECYKFLGNIYNILNQSTDPKSQTVASCVDVLQKCIQSRNKTIMNIVKEINFLPAVTKLLFFINDDNNTENLTKLMILIKDLIRFNNELDEHNLKVFITSLRDLIENFQGDTKIVTLAIHILSNLAMNNDGSKYLIGRIIKTTAIQNKINKSSDLIALKFLIISYGEFLPKDFPYLIKLSIESIAETIETCDSEALIHTIDMLQCAKQIFNNTNKYFLISEINEIVNMFDRLNGKLTTLFLNEKASEMKKEFLDNVFNYYGLLLEFDNKLVQFLEEFTADIFEKSDFTRSASGLRFLSSFISSGGTFQSIDKVVDSIVKFFNNNVDSDFICNGQRYEFLKLLKVLHENEKLTDSHFKSALEYIESILTTFQDLKIQNIDEETICLVVYVLQAVNSLSSECSLFKEVLDKLIKLNFLPYTLAKAYKLKNPEILQILFSLTAIDKFPKEKVAMLLSQAEQPNFTKATSFKEVKNREPNSSTSKYITGHLLHELDDLIKRINQTLDNDATTLKESDVIALYRQKNSYLQDHLTTVTESLGKYADLYNDVQQQNLVLRKLSEKQEVINWSLQLDKEKYMKENQNLESDKAVLLGSVTTFKNKIEKEISQNFETKKLLTIKEAQIEKLMSEKSSMESERQKFRQAHKESEIRIQQLKQSLEEEKKLRETEVGNVRAELKRTSVNYEKEHGKYQEIIKLNESELMQKQQRILELETELKEAEKIQTSIMSIMQKSKSK